MNIKTLVKNIQKTSINPDYLQGVLFEYGICCEQSYLEAFDHYRSAAFHGSFDACYKIGTFYELGLGRSVNVHEAIEWYSKCNSWNHQMAENRIDNLRKIVGKSVGIQPVKESPYIKKKGSSIHLVPCFVAAVLGQTDAINDLACLIHEESFITCPSSVVLHLLKNAADLGNPYAMYNLGLAYSRGIGGQKSPSEAKKAFEKSMKSGFYFASHVLNLTYHSPFSSNTFSSYLFAYSNNETYGDGLNKNHLNTILKEYMNPSEDVISQSFSIDNLDAESNSNICKDLYDRAIDYDESAFNELYRLVSYDNATAMYYLGKLMSNIGTSVEYSQAACDYLDKAKKSGYPVSKSERDIVGRRLNKQDTCPLCGAGLVIRPGRNGGSFKGCSRYPSCNYTTQVSYYVYATHYSVRNLYMDFLKRDKNKFIK